MKIWQRIFLVSLILVTIFILLIGLILIDNQLRTDIGQAVSGSSGIHKEINLFLGYKIESVKNDQGRIVVDDDTFESVVQEILNREEYSSYGIGVSIDDIKTLENMNFSDTDYNIDSQGNDSAYMIAESSNGYILVFYSKREVYGRNLLTITEYNISSVYNSYNAQIRQLQYWSLLLSLAAALILLVMIRLMLKPLKKLQDEIHEIAKGNYGKPLEIKGNTEISELARDVNIMSQEIEKNINGMEEAIESRKIFIDNMTHEMKTPLTSILGFADILSVKPNLTENQRREYSEIIYNEASRLKSMSNKLMELVQMQGNSIKLEKLNLTELIKETIQTQIVLLKEASVGLEGRLCNAEIYGDEDLLKSVFLNILDNAKKASKPNSRIDVNMQKANGKVVVRIQDYGVGIPPAELKKVMEPFYMVDKSRARKSGGAGLGLALCKRIIEMHDGDINIRSKEGVGTTVYVTLPEAREKGDHDEK